MGSIASSILSNTTAHWIAVINTMSLLGLSASQLQGLPAAWSPLFDVCHFLLAALAVRKEVGVVFSRSNPLATWLATMTASFAGSMIANPLLGKPIMGALSNEYNVLLATIIWWGVFYSPGDLVYALAMNQVGGKKKKKVLCFVFSSVPLCSHLCNK